MPQCMLRVTGGTRKIRKFLEDSSFEPSSVFYKGDPGFPASRGPRTTSGFNIILSTSNNGLIGAQAKEATAFIKKSFAEFERLSGFGFDSVCLDFGLYDLSTDMNPWPSYRLPNKIVEYSGTLGFEIVLSFYGHE